jgi:hypothetical protein
MLRILAWVLAITVHAGETGLEPTDKLVPPGWRGNPWGPEATQARKVGELPPIPMTAKMSEWDAWGRKVLRDGDLVFRQGDARLLFGYFRFSRFLATTSGSPYSHVGVVAVEDGEPVVYDTTKAGVRRQPFHIWVLDNVGGIGVKRLKKEHESHIPGIINWLHQTYEDQVPFDYVLGLDDSALYCVEMAEKAYRAEGLTLSEPVKLGDMENSTKYPIVMFSLQFLSRWVVGQQVTFEQPVFLPGNERHGIWASPLLETVYPASEPVAKPEKRSRTDIARDRKARARRS